MTDMEFLNMTETAMQTLRKMFSACHTAEEFAPDSLKPAIAKYQKDYEKGMADSLHVLSAFAAGKNSSMDNIEEEALKENLDNYPIEVANDRGYLDAVIQVKAIVSTFRDKRACEKVLRELLLNCRKFWRAQTKEEYAV